MAAGDIMGRSTGPEVSPSVAGRFGGPSNGLAFCWREKYLALGLLALGLLALGLLALGLGSLVCPSPNGYARPLPSAEENKELPQMGRL